MCIRDRVRPHPRPAGRDRPGQAATARPHRVGRRPGPGPVSYTHLDVYKRQHVHLARDIAGGAADGLDERAGRAEEAFLVGVEDADERDLRPVSYTHLDVYKRQPRALGGGHGGALERRHRRQGRGHRHPLLGHPVLLRARRAAGPAPSGLRDPAQPGACLLYTSRCV